MLRDITITTLDAIHVFDLVGGDYKFTLDELQSSQIANTQEKVDITGKNGRKLSSLKRNKAVVVSGTNGLVSGGLLEVQTGGKFVQKETSVLVPDYLTITSNGATTNYTAIGDEGAEIVEIIVLNTDGTQVQKLTQDATAGDGTFTYDPDTKKLGFNTGAFADGTEIAAYYFRKINANVLENVSDTYSEKCTMYIDATGEDICGNIYRVQFYIPKADFSGNFDLTLGENKTVHAFEAESLAGACGKNGSMWTYTVYGVDTEDVTA